MKNISPINNSRVYVKLSCSEILLPFMCNTNTNYYTGTQDYNHKELRMKKTSAFVAVFTLLLSFVVPIASDCFARPDAGAKFSITREENPKGEKETLILPYAFPSDSMGTTFGVGAIAKGYGQDQLLFGGTVYGSLDDARGIIAGMWDYRLPKTERFYLSILGALSYFPRQRAYTEVPRRPSGTVPAQAGTNDSDEDNYVEDDGNDNWVDIKLEYVLPIGSMANSGMAQYHLKDGILQSGATGGDIWNPLESGVSVLLFGSTSRYQSYNTESFTFDGDTYPFQIGYLYNNTDFPSNPTKGSSQYLSYQQDFSDSNSGNWNFLEFEASKYFDLGTSGSARQRVFALNFWTGSSLSWNETINAEGLTVVEDNPPFLEGARLGGFYRMKGYPNNRFNDRSVIYTTAEYRHTLTWNPVANVSWLRWLKLDWFQLVGFVEGGRVAGDYEFSELFSDWKADVGIGIRSMMAGSVVRFDMAVSDEGGAAWVMFGHPF